jgi:aprataxin
MAPKPKAPEQVEASKTAEVDYAVGEGYKQTHPQSNTRASTSLTNNVRDGLLGYILSPSTSPRVIYYNDQWVLIRDLYPKATVHLLLLPRDPEYYTQHPFRAFQDPGFLAQAREEVVKAKRIAGSELRRLLGKFSETERPRIEAMNAEFDADAPAELPSGRDWESEIKVGIHAYPSMSHMHIHIISKDMHSKCVRRKQHYNTFNTPFLVNMEEFPLAEDDIRWTLNVKPYYHDWDFKCWRCDKNFGNKLTELKRHLEKEFLEWRSE